MYISGNTPAVVGDRDHTVLMHLNEDVFGTTGNGFVEGVVEDLDQEMVEAFFVGAADVHTGAFSDRFEAFQNGNIFGGVSIVWHR